MLLFAPKAEIDARIAKLQMELAASDIEGAILMQNSDLFYFSGTVQNSQLYLPVSGEPVLAVRKSYSRACQESPLTNIAPMKSAREFPDIIKLFGYCPGKQIGLELDVMPVNKMFELQRLWPGCQFVDVSPMIKKLRMIKSAYEVKLVRETLRIMDIAFREVPGLVREGMQENELFGLIAAVLRREGIVESSRMRAFNQDFLLGTVSCGSSAACSSGVDGSVGGAGLNPAYPAGPSHKTILRNEVIYVDLTPVGNGYTGDQTRIYCIGELSPKMVKAHQDALLINEELLKLLKPGVLAEDAYYLGVKLAAEMGYQDHFLGYRDDQVRFIGHGIGLDCDELPVFAPGAKIPMQAGMTFALEPKLVFSEGAIGTESTYVMTDSGPECLSITPLDITYIK